MAEQLAIGLKTEIKRQAGLKNWQAREKERTKKYLIKAWVRLNDTQRTDAAEELIWDYIKYNLLAKKIESKEIGVFTTIDDYTKKNGEIIKAHYSECGTYIGSVKKLGNEPVSYRGWFEITPERFRINFHQDLDDCSDISELFAPIEQSLIDSSWVYCRRCGGAYNYHTDGTCCEE